MGNVRRYLVLGATTALMAALLAWSFRGVNARELLDAFRSARWIWLPPALLAGLAVFPLKALRWKVLLTPVRKVPFRPLFSSIMIGFMVNCIFSRIGEVVRGVVLSLKGGVSAPVSLASIALERIFDMCIVILFLVTALLWLRPEAGAEGAANLAMLRKAGAVLAILFVVAVIFLTALKLRPKTATAVMLGSLFWLPRSVRSYVAGFLTSFLTGLDTLRSIEQVALLLALSLVHWAAQVLYFLFIGYCFPDLQFTLPIALLIFSVTALGVGAAPTPFYLGIFQAGILGAGAIVGMTAALRPAWTSYAWLAWAGNIPVIIVIGIIVLWAEGLSFREIRGKTTGAVTRTRTTAIAE